MSLSRNDILNADDLKKEKVDVPEWGGFIYMKTQTGTEKDAFESSMLNAKGEVSLDNLRARMVAMCAVDEESNRIFSDADVEALGKKSAAALDRCFSVAKRLNGTTDEDIEQMGKLLEQTQDDASTSE